MPPLTYDADHDILQALVRWVEEDVPPERINAVHYTNNNVSEGVEFTRPICKLSPFRFNHFESYFKIQYSLYAPFFALCIYSTPLVHVMFRADQTIVLASRVYEIIVHIHGRNVSTSHESIPFYKWSSNKPVRTPKIMWYIHAMYWQEPVMYLCGRSHISTYVSRGWSHD